MTLEQIITVLESTLNYPFLIRYNRRPQVYIHMKNGDSYEIINSLDEIEQEKNKCRDCIKHKLGERAFSLKVKTENRNSYYLKTFPEEVSHFIVEY